MNLFAVGRDHGVYSTWWEEKEGWQEWTRIGDQQLAKGSQVTALLSDETRVNLFVVGVDGGVYTTHYDFPTRKIGTEFVANVDPDERRPVGTGNKEAKPGIGPVTPERRSDNRLGRAPSVGPGRTTPDRASKDRGAVVKPSVSPPCTSEKIACWQPWKRIGNQIASPGAQVTAVRSRPGHIDLFVVGQHGKVYTTWGAKNRSWQDWFPIGTQSVSSATVFFQLSGIFDGYAKDIFVPPQKVETLEARTHSVQREIDRRNMQTSASYDFSNRNWIQDKVPIRMVTRHPILLCIGI